MTYELKPTSIIAMKGLPCTGKTVCATLIAASLKCPVLSLDDFLDDLHPHYFQTPLSTASSSPQPRDLAFQIICKITRSHLWKGLVDNIVIDSPLSSRSHLEKFIRLASLMPKARIVIVECKPSNVYIWQTKFEEYVEVDPDGLADKWYKAKDWDEVMKAAHDDYDERSNGCRVSKLVLDPFSSYQRGFCDKIYHSLLTGKSFEPPAFMEAVNYMITREESEGPDLVVHNQWRQSMYPPPPNEKVVEVGVDGSESGQTSTTERRFCSGARHSVTNYTEKLVLEYEEANCLVCEQPVTDAAYTCTACNLALHQECVEPSSTFKPLSITKASVWLPCASCNKDGESELKYNCASCIFQLKLRLLAYNQAASVIRHECEEHFLFVDVSSPY